MHDGEKISQIKFEETFLKSLLDKLKVGNRRGIHLNAVPGRARSRLDLKELDKIKEGKAEDFLNTLLSNNEFKYTIDFEGIDLSELDEDEKNALYFISKKLNNISVDNEDQFLESGIKNFGFGYPMLVRRDNSDPSKVIKAPLLIWNLEIERSNRKSNSWTISKNEDQPIRINELFRSHILKDAQVSIDSLNDDFLEDNLIDKDELQEICSEIISQLNTGSKKTIINDLKIEKCPSGKKIDSLATDNTWIQWSGIFGIYTSRKESVIRQTEEILKNLKEFQDEKLILDKFQTSTVSAVSTDPSKEEIINSLTDNEIKLIQGPPGTGKSQALTAVITNVLQNEGTCLVVCEKKTALSVIQKNLEKIGLSELSVVIDDISRDRAKVVKKARSIVDGLKNGVSSYSNNRIIGDFNRKYLEFKELKESFNSKHLSENENKINEENWKNAIGQFLGAVSSVDWKLIKEIFSEQKPNISNIEINTLLAEMQDASTAYSNVNRHVYNALFNLKKDFFNSPYNKKLSDEIKDDLFEVHSEIDNFNKYISEVETDSMTYEEFDVFDIDKLRREKEKDEHNLELVSTVQKNLKEFYLILNAIKASNFKSNIFKEESNKEDVGVLKISDINDEIKKLLEHSKENVSIYSSIEDIYKNISSYSTQSIHADIKEIVKESLDIFNFKSINDLKENELKRLEVLKSIEKNILNIKYKKDLEKELLKFEVSDVLKLIFQKDKSAFSDKKEIKKHYLEDGKTLSSISIYQDFDLKKISSIRSKLTKLITSIKKKILSLDHIDEVYNTTVSFENDFKLSYLKLFTEPMSDLNSFEEFSGYKNYVLKEVHRLNNAINNYSDYKGFHDWNYFYENIDAVNKKILSTLLDNGIDSGLWISSVKAWIYYHLLSDIEEQSGNFHTDGDELSKLIDLYNELKEDQKKVIRSIWEHNLVNQVGDKFKLLYNLRKNKVHNKTNSLRKIINQDFELFTSIFPVILTNPMAADSMLPLELGIFDTVIFDEASQLRIEDTFTSLIRGKYKIIAGDQHQMPPSNYFQTVGDITETNDDEDDEVRLENEELALSESLLEYADKLGFQSQSYLDYHYRSQHPALIDFSNAAFYGGNLVPFPEQFAYNPISFYEVNGVYEDRINESEVEKVIDILKNEIKKKKDGSYPSIGIATFNLPQRNRIIDRLNEEVISDNSFSKKMDKIRESGNGNGLFIKNLENIQGDEMDVIIISTTYGKDRKGKFFERFGPLNLEKGYKLLNVLITRARDRIYICSSIPRNRYSKYDMLLDEYGNNKKAVFYAYLTYAKNISDNEPEDANHVKEKLIEHSHDQPRAASNKEDLIESPFEAEVYECLLEKIDENKIIPQKRIGGFRVDFLINLKDRKVVLECDGKAYHSTNEAYAHDIFRQKELEELGFEVYRIWSTSWWHDHEREINKLLEYLEKKYYERN